MIIVILAFFLCGCQFKKQQERDDREALREFFFRFDNNRYTYRGCLIFDSAQELTGLILNTVEEDRLLALRQERSDFLEVIRVAVREISHIDNEISEIESEGRIKSAQRDQLRRERATELNMLWKETVAATDRRFMERARRFQVALATRMTERGVSILSEPVLLEPPEAAKIFEEESRRRGFWASDEDWLQSQLEAWKVYEQVWRQTRSRIRREIEKVQTESLAKLLEIEESLLRDDKKVSELQTKREKLTKPLSEALDAIARIDFLLVEMCQKCAVNLKEIWEKGSVTNASQSGGVVRLPARKLTQGRYFLLFEDGLGMLHLGVAEMSEPGEADNVVPFDSIRPFYEIFR